MELRCVVALLTIQRVGTLNFTTGDFMHRWRRLQTLPGHAFKAALAIPLMEEDS